MDSFFIILFLLSPLLLIVGLIKPNIFSFTRISNLTRKKITLFSLALALFSFIGVGVTSDSTKPDESKNNEEVISEETQVSSLEQLSGDVVIKRVIDGDTVETESGLKIRYIGMDTPEPSSDDCYSEEATQKNRGLVEGKQVRLEKDVSEIDQFNRLLRYLWIGDSMVNELLVREGYAKASSYPPDVKYQDRFREVERLAREERLGLWGDVCTPISSPTKTPPSVPTATPKPAVKSTQTQIVQPTQIPYIPPTPYPTSSYVQPTTPVPTTPPSSGGSWSCNCSKTCTQITSCAEAYYQLNSCGCSVRDGDNDGIPCENLCE